MPEQQMTEEQVQELQEKIKNMSPEELKEFQKKQCIFCHIVEGKVQSKKIYEDDKSLAILDINPSNPGHVLLLPKEHYSIMPQLSEEEIAHLFMVTKTISNAVLRSLDVQGTNIIVQNGVAAGQKAQHFMIHIIPRKEKDGLKFELPQKEIPEAELEAVRKKLAAKLGEVKETKIPAPNVQELIKSKSHKPKVSDTLRNTEGISGVLRNSKAISDTLRNTEGISGVLRNRKAISDTLRNTEGISGVLRNSKAISDRLETKSQSEKVVEAEFKENQRKIKEQVENKAAKKQKKEKTKKGTKQKETSKNTKQNNKQDKVGLDDIANLLGVK